MGENLYDFDYRSEVFGDTAFDRHFFSKLTPIKYSVQQQQMIINGVQHVQEIKTPYVVCPYCDRIIAQLPQGLSYIEMVSVCQQQLEGNVTHCNNCGQKLKYPSLLAFE